MAFNTYPIQLVSGGQMLNFVGDNVSGLFPATNLLTVPVSISIYGNTANLMGKPEGFINIQISGMDYKLPFYK